MSPLIFQALRDTPPRDAGELELTDAIARSLDLSATYTGSGGAIVVIAPRRDEVATLTQVLQSAGARVAIALF